MEILRMIGQGFGTSEMAKELSVSSRTITTCMQLLRQKLKAKNNRELLKIAIEYIHHYTPETS
ncbi:MAG: hypothetical protein HQM08_05975 [Candidatus Riflebacteria bacterium]|nr:hypothetical protein [Candidatus Riflebacteria bacterium]